MAELVRVRSRVRRERPREIFLDRAPHSSCASPLLISHLREGSTSTIRADESGPNGESRRGALIRHCHQHDHIYFILPHADREAGQRGINATRPAGEEPRRGGDDGRGHGFDEREVLRRPFYGAPEIYKSRPSPSPSCPLAFARPSLDLCSLHNRLP